MEYSIHAPKSWINAQKKQNKNKTKRENFKHMAGAISQAAAAALKKALILEAKGLVATNKPKLKLAETNAKRATQQINSIFKQADNIIKKAGTEEGKISEKAQSQLEGMRDKANEKGELNDQLYASIEEKLGQIKEETETKNKKTEEQKKLADKIALLGGKTQEKPEGEEGPGDKPVGDTDATEMVENSGGGTQTKGTTTKPTGRGRTNRSQNSGGAQRGNQTPNNKGDKEELKRLQKEYKAITKEIKGHSTNIDKMQNGSDGIVQSAATIIENAAFITEQATSMQGVAGTANEQLSQQESKIQGTSKDASSQMEGIKKSEDAAEGTNIEKGDELREKEKDINSRAGILQAQDQLDVKRASKKVGELGDKFGGKTSKDSVANTNKDNVKSATDNMEAITNAANNSKYNELSGAINDLLTSAIAEIKAHKLEVPEGVDAKGGDNNGKGKDGGIDIDVGNLIGSGFDIVDGLMSGSFSGVDTSAEGITNMVIDLASDIGGAFL